MFKEGKKDGDRKSDIIEGKNRMKIRVIEEEKKIKEKWKERKKKTDRQRERERERERETLLYGIKGLSKY